MNKNTYLYIAVFISGLAGLAIEMTASRLLGSVFGSSNLVWAAIIGLILLYLTLGYFIGGKWADRSPYEITFYSILAWAGLAIGIVPLISRPVLRMSANAFDALQMGILFGSFVAVVILFIIPVTLLGTASPFAIRLAIHDARNAGSVSGRIYAVSTLGSFIGTFLPVLVLIPLIGTFRTFLVISGLLLAVAFIGLYRSGGRRRLLAYLWMPVLLALVAIYALRGTDRSTSGMIFETESAYNYIQVLELDGTLYLRLNEGQGVHSIYHPTTVNFFGPWEQALVAPYFNEPPFSPDQVKRIAILGLAGGTTARGASLVYGSIPIDGYEIDPEIVEVAQTYFDMNQSNLNIHIQDARVGLAASRQLYDIISVDAYRPPYIPWHLTTREFFESIYDHLTPQGVLAINVGRAPGDRRVVDALGTTLLAVFPTIHAMDIPGSFNTILFATRQPTTTMNFMVNYEFLSSLTTVHPLLLESMQLTITNLQPRPETTLVFTDDRAQIEWLTNDLVLDFLFFGDKELLQ
ncbi:MAG: fused MFS/spermidine synthase [Anaerolineaceae bacterium]|nr:fused MFS/spermidine synthase [Anaerolineaceae bacterium]MBN2676485.1 fused MFS/spermidine synthase [Anaerolineaceae bacterium]